MKVPEAVVSHHKLRVLYRVRVAVGPAASAAAPQIPSQVPSARGFDFLQVYIYISTNIHIFIQRLYIHICTHMCARTCVSIFSW